MQKHQHSYDESPQSRWLMNPQFKIYILSDFFSTFGMLFRSQSSNQHFFFGENVKAWMSWLGVISFFGQKSFSVLTTFEIPSILFRMAHGECVVFNVFTSQCVLVNNGRLLRFVMFCDTLVIVKLSLRVVVLWYRFGRAEFARYVDETFALISSLAHAQSHFAMH